MLARSDELERNNNMSINKGRKLRDDGMSEAVDAEGNQWASMAYKVMCLIAKTQPTVHVDDVIGAVGQPDHPNAWGSVWMRAIKNGVLQRTSETRQTADPLKHAHRYPVYASNLYQE